MFEAGASVPARFPVEVKSLPLEEQKADLPAQVERDFIQSKPMRGVVWASVLLAFLQSLCTAVFAISGVRVAIGLSALAAASGIYAPAKGWHQDAIRIPMLIAATIGALLNLGVIAWMRHLRNRPEAHWRRRERNLKEKRSEKLQIVLAVVTLVLVGLETWTHPMVHRSGPPPPCRIAHTC